MEADEEFRNTELRAEWKLNGTIFSYRPDPFAEVTNAFFSVSWEGKRFYFFYCVGKILQKICPD